LAIEYLEEEVLVVRVSLACPPERLDHAIGPFDPAAADMAAGRGNDPSPVSLCEAGNPGEVPISRLAADLHDPLHGSAHILLLRAQVSLKEHLICDVAGAGQLVLGYEVLVVLQGVALLHGQLIAEKSIPLIPLETSLPDKDVALFSVPGVRTRHKDVLGVLERAGLACKPPPSKALPVYPS